MTKDDVHHVALAAESSDTGRSSTAVEVRFFGGQRIGEAAIQLVSAAADHGEAFGSFNEIILRAHRGTTATEIVEGFARETASTAAHTPGPWKVGNGELVRVLPVGSDTPICGVHRRGQDGTQDQRRAIAEANARLIAAAPLMLAVLQKIMADKHPDTRMRPDHIHAARAVIRMATRAP